MGEFMGLSVNEGVKSYLQWLGREYEFCYMFTGEKFGLVNNLNLLKKPVLILGPEDDSEKYKGIMRLWAYGGSIGTIDMESGDIDISSESKNYLPYLSDGFRNKKKYPEEFWQEGLFCELDMPACQKYAKLLKAHDRTSGRIDKLLLDLSVFAAYTRFLSRKEYKTYPSYPQEKSIQCVIAKYSMLNSVWKENADSLVVIDVETHLFKQGGRHPRADFAVFDGNAFGLVEFKYLGQSIDSKNNNLAKHYEDFATAMEPQNGEKLFKLLKMKLKYLMGYGLIDESWQKKVMEICDREYDRSALWCGFYFLGDAADIPGKKKNIVVDRIERQIKPIRKKMPVRGQISKIDPDHLDEIRMNIKEIREIKEDADDAEA